MKPRQYRFHSGIKGAAMLVRVIPRAKKNEIFQILADGTVKIRLTAPPVGGKANQALIRFLASHLNVPANRIEIVAGHSRRNKLIAVEDMDQGTLQQLIEAGISGR